MIRVAYIWGPLTLKKDVAFSSAGNQNTIVCALKLVDIFMAEFYRGMSLFWFQLLLTTLFWSSTQLPKLELHVIFLAFTAH